MWNVRSGWAVGTATSPLPSDILPLVTILPIGSPSLSVAKIAILQRDRNACLARRADRSVGHERAFRRSAHRVGGDITASSCSGEMTLANDGVA
jgi:hypothetical protein